MVFRHDKSAAKSLPGHLLPIALIASMTFVPVRGTAEVASPFATQVRKDTEWLATFDSRIVGSKGHDKSVAQLSEKIRALPNVQVWTQQFPVGPVARQASRLSSLACGCEIEYHSVRWAYRAPDIYWSSGTR